MLVYVNLFRAITLQICPCSSTCENGMKSSNMAFFSNFDHGLKTQHYEGGHTPSSINALTKSYQFLHYRSISKITKRSHCERWIIQLTTKSPNWFTINCRGKMVIWQSKVKNFGQHLIFKPQTSFDQFLIMISQSMAQKVSRCKSFHIWTVEKVNCNLTRA